MEEVLENLVEQSRDNRETLRELASVRFYLCDLLHNVTLNWLNATDRVTNYAPLVRDILRFNMTEEEVCLVTFNYDLLLDDALHTFGFKALGPVEHLDSHPVLKLFKLHGSVDWCRLVDLPNGTRLSTQLLINQADSIGLTDIFVRANATNSSDANAFAKPIFPAIAVPVQRKSEEHFECPAKHREYLTKMLPRITNILIVGWQAKEAHFLEMLRRSGLQSLRNVMVVGANERDAKETLRYFLGEIGRQPQSSSVATGGFTDFIVNHEGDSFFNS